MKRVLLFLTVLAFVCVCECETSRNRCESTDMIRQNFKEVVNINDSKHKKVDYSVRVVAVTDGDTFKGLTDDKTQITFRIQGIDAPEKSQDYYQKSKQKLSDLIYGKTAGIIIHKKRDKYGRAIVYVKTPSGEDVGAEMLKSGLAWHYKKYDKSKHYAEFERVAKSKKVGLWSFPNPVPPWEYRANKRKKK